VARTGVIRLLNMIFGGPDPGEPDRPYRCSPPMPIDTPGLIRPVALSWLLDRSLEFGTGKELSRWQLRRSRGREGLTGLRRQKPELRHRRCERIIAGSIGFTNFFTVSERSRTADCRAARSKSRIDSFNSSCQSLIQALFFSTYLNGPNP
jgi:hypothetical protein